MKKDYNTKKKVTIIALSLTAVCLAGGLFYYVGTLNNSEPTTLPTQTPPTTESQIVVPEIKPEGTQGSTDNSGITNGTPSVEGDVQDKPSDGKPKTPEEATPPAEPPKTEDGKDKTPPKTPDTSKPDTGKEHEFTPDNPSKQPEYKPEQTEPNNNSGKPKDGDTKDGKIYIEGFGWIENEGENSQGGTDNGNHNGNKVGDM